MNATATVNISHRSSACQKRVVTQGVKELPIKIHMATVQRAGALVVGTWESMG